MLSYCNVVLLQLLQSKVTFIIVENILGSRSHHLCRTKSEREEIDS